MASSGGSVAMADGWSPVEDQEWQRTQMHCHDCGREFVAEVQFGVDGNHIIECPGCGHEHCRVIEDGKITSDRWDSRYGDARTHEARTMWKSDDRKKQSSTASQYIRRKFLDEAWRNRSDRQR